MDKSLPFLIGCNYWASHAGIEMWHDWQPEVVREDLRQLAREGVRVLRVFPLWSDFQPLTLLRQFQGKAREYRRGEEVLGEDPIAAAGVDRVMLDRFAFLADEAQAAGLKLIVGLVTGWMSGRFFAPPGLEHLDAISDPESIRWQVRFVRTFVRHFRSHPAIQSWDLGNECNCMGNPGSTAQAWLWTNTISSAIRLEDPSRQVVSGMHSMSASPAGTWTIRDQGELTDILTTHPYPAFTPGCDLDPLNTLRPAHHAAAESCLYADLSGKPCLVEEIGSLGSEFGNEQTVADYVRMSLYTSWACGATGFMWWCGYDQTHLVHAPYDWNSVERELGLFRKDRTPKLLVHELKAFGQFLQSLPFAQLPAPRRQAVCVLTDSQDHWKVAYATFLLARQAGVSVRFVYHDQPLPEAPIYLVPCYSGLSPMSRRRWLELQERVQQHGATLYLSHQDGVLSMLKETTGMEVVSRSRSTEPTQFALPSGQLVAIPAGHHLELTPAGAQVLASDANGAPVLTSWRNGAGQVYLLTVPLEMHLANLPGAFHAKGAPDWASLYACVFSRVNLDRAVRQTLRSVGVTEHELPTGRRVVVQINYSGQEQPLALPTSPWRVAGKLAPGTSLPPYSATVFEVEYALPAGGKSAGHAVGEMPLPAAAASVP